MRAKIFVVLILAASILSALADDDQKFPRLQIGNETFTNVIITRVTATDVYFIHAGGAENVKLKTLSPELQKLFKFDPQQAKKAEQKLAEDKVKYHDQVVQAAAAEAAAASFWHDTLVRTLNEARAEKKLVLLDFTGSDWCVWCMKFDQDILSTSKFVAYASQKLLLVKVDFPRQTAQPDDLKRVNRALAEHFSLESFPTFVLLDTDGKELGRQVGYLNGGPDAFIAELDKFNP